ncbi:bacteriocin immunity protein, partial [Lactococcus lactis subsp. lactis]|uniref:bacteriocin immunity protein n=1 Tax=Lactococcus lactis TaxID=1358 RepID=UPI00223B243B
RKIVQLGRKDLEKKVYSLSVANKMVATFQREAISSKLSEDTSALYKSLKDYISKNMPLGTARVTGVNAGYNL